ncbi:hypothetical protein AXX17_AT3G46110 [Arabidopsis thaliana]|uniref:Uncharacterized protein n=3 Tax=Arabidopsis TaxID=3701 RepID=A0A178VIW2_ARATH|nr:hypothetical protein AXX17_AT3G46110 [Arabidopsis thaliana]
MGIFNKLVLDEPRPADLFKLWEMFDVHFCASQDDHNPNMTETEAELEIVVKTMTQLESEAKILPETKTKRRRFQWICCFNP